MTDSNSSTYSLSAMYDRITSEKPYFDYESFANQVMGLLDGRSVILELCVGTGNLAKVFTARGLSVIGIDSDDNMLELCSRKFGDLEGLTLLKGDATNFEPVDGVEAVVIHSGHIIFNRRPDGGIFLNAKSEEVVRATFSAIAAQLQSGGMLVMNVETWADLFYEYRDGAFYSRTIKEDTEEYGTRVHIFYDPNYKTDASGEPTKLTDRLALEIKIREPKFSLEQVNALHAELGLQPYGHSEQDVIAWVKSA